MAFRLGTTMRNAGIAAIAAVVDQGSGAGKLRVRTSTQPATVASSENGTLLGTLTLGDPAFGSPATGVVTADTITSDTSADASGTAGHFRILDSDDNPLADGTCGMGSGDLSFDNNVIVAGGTIAISALTMTQPIS